MWESAKQKEMGYFKGRRQGYRMGGNPLTLKEVGSGKNIPGVKRKPGRARQEIMKVKNKQLS